ncbi:MAG: hypothetical protein AB7V48_06525 [Sedimentibacter sp.]
MQTTKEMANELKSAYLDKFFINTLTLEFLLDLTSEFEKQYNLPFGSSVVMHVYHRLLLHLNNH